MKIKNRKSVALKTNNIILYTPSITLSSSFTSMSCQEERPRQWDSKAINLCMTFLLTCCHWPVNALGKIMSLVGVSERAVFVYSFVRSVCFFVKF